jgi:hypothetical protein
MYGLSFFVCGDECGSAHQRAQRGQSRKAYRLREGSAAKRWHPLQARKSPPARGTGELLNHKRFISTGVENVIT